MSVFVSVSSQLHRAAGLKEPTGKTATYFSHVADSHQLANGRQVEAVHFVLDAARYLTVAAAKVGHHQRRRPAGAGGPCEFRF